MELEPPTEWKSDCLRFGMAPFKAYVIGVPLIVVIWLTKFPEPTPRGWNDLAEQTYARVLAQISLNVGHGYLVCLAGLMLAGTIGCRIRDVKAVRAALCYGLVALFCWFWSFMLSNL
jgi:hypothetical protein